jgi:hypothetical protein
MSVDTVHSLANWFLLFSLILGVISTFAIVVSGNIKEDRLKAELAEANARAAEANKRTEELRKQNLELEKAVAPRSVGDQLELAKKLRPFAGTQVMVETLNDAETARLAGQIIFVLQEAGWKVIPAEGLLNNPGFFDGVTVKANIVHPNESGEIVHDDTGPAADALVTALNGVEVAARRFPGKALPLHTIKVQVGLKPLGYFLPKKVKDALEEAREMMERPERSPEEDKQ